ncbi:MAG: hypothetical protein JRF33_02175 [Deltaproteobacteria bacterium]|nr:hypothetical protein [Deltaproteobacteria bacterium]
MEQEATKKKLIIFDVGGTHFGAVVEGLHSIESKDWTDAIDLGPMLGLAAHSGRRVLVVETQKGPFGIRVDDISSRMINQHLVHPVPRALADWMEVPAISGITVDPEYGIIHVLNLKKLATLKPEPS